MKSKEIIEYLDEIYDRLDNSFLSDERLDAHQVALAMDDILTLKRELLNQQVE